MLQPLGRTVHPLRCGGILAGQHDAPPLPPPSLPKKQGKLKWGAPIPHFGVQFWGTEDELFGGAEEEGKLRGGVLDGDTTSPIIPQSGFFQALGGLVAGGAAPCRQGRRCQEMERAVCMCVCGSMMGWFRDGRYLSPSSRLGTGRPKLAGGKGDCGSEWVHALPPPMQGLHPREAGVTLGHR